ncbi:hypothetical protein MNBD_GAMMA07-817 [hydrothermal vent metagenome]|uniref:4Fe-4S ferredoxin-type domain-containing protein n=1 Tax=hydrothermal vent metagenome TaxID=652676 RepID=A0A3B0WXL9_9ZZZZ
MTDKILDRRAFLTRGIGKAAQVITKHAVDKARENASHWIRPPFAIEEFDFLMACDRCGECIEACPHHIIFPLSSKLGAKVFSTPAMDLLNHGCHMCEDWPCVNVCKTTALTGTQLLTDLEQAESVEALKNENIARDEIEHSDNNLGQQPPKIAPPKIARVSININTCLPYNGPECGACRVCPVENAMLWELEKPTINNECCTGCALCREACIVEPKAINVQSNYKQQV